MAETTLHHLGLLETKGERGALCVEMDFTRTFQASTKCNNMNLCLMLFLLGFGRFEVP